MNRDSFDFFFFFFFFFLSFSMKIGFRTSIFYALRCDRGQRDNNSKDSISQKMKYLVVSLVDYENKNRDS